MAYVQELIPSVWVIRIVIGLMGFVINGSLLHSEFRKRRFPTPHFSNALLRLTSAGCLWSGFIAQVLLIFTVIPGFCMIEWMGTMIAGYLEFFFLSFYQLSRLYYCFSNQQIHGKHGYPIWIFCVMIIIGIINWISGVMLQIFVVTLPSKCGYRNDWSFFYRNRDRAILFDGDLWEDAWMSDIFYLWNFALLTSAHICDLIILMLYSCKIRQIGKSLKSKTDGVWNNVLFILYRIVIINVFYQFCGLCLVTVYSAWGILLGSGSGDAVMYSISNELRISGVTAGGFFIYSFSMFMMMDHNTKAFVHYLYFLRRSHLKYICLCCCHKLVDQQIEYLEQPNALELQTNCTNAKVDIESTMFPDLPHPSTAFPKEIREMSWESATVTHIVNDDLE